MKNDSDVLEQFHTYLLAERRVAINTFAAYKQDVAQLAAYMEQHALSYSTLNKRHVRDFLKSFRDQGCAAKTMSRKISSLKLFFTFVHDRFKFTDHGKALVFPTVEKTLPTYLSEAEVQRLLTAANTDSSDKGIRNKVMLYLLYASGMRVSELVDVTVDQINFDTGFINLIGKGRKERAVPLPKNILELLKHYLDNVYNKLIPDNVPLHNVKKKYLFAAVYNQRVKQLSRQSMWIILKKVLARASIAKNITPHSLRHSLATHLLKNGADIRTLQMLLGHENLATVQIYTHLEKSEMRKIYDQKHPRA